MSLGRTWDEIILIQGLGYNSTLLSHFCLLYSSYKAIKFFQKLIQNENDNHKIGF